MGFMKNAGRSAGGRKDATLACLQTPDVRPTYTFVHVEYMSSVYTNVDHAAPQPPRWLAYVPVQGRHSLYNDQKRDRCPKVPCAHTLAGRRGAAALERGGVLRKRESSTGTY